MEEHAFLEQFLLGGAILLGAAVLFVLPFRRLGLGAVLGYLIAGVIVGPDMFGLVGEAESLMTFSEIGIVLLLFIVGLELSPRRLWLMRKDIFVLGPAQVILCGLAMFGVILATMGFSWQAALVLGLPLGLSSTAQVLPLLQSGGRLSKPYGQKAFSILLFQDLSIVPLLTIVAVLSRAPTVEGHASGPILALYAVLAIAALVIAGRYLLSPLLHVIGKVAERELFIVAGLFAVLASAALMQNLGLSAALGGFVAGVMLAESPYRHELEADIDPFRSLLLGLFFLSVGMMLDVDVVLEFPLLIVGLAAALIAIKVVIMWGLARLSRLKGRDAVVIALLLSQGGEFGFVLFNAAQRALLIEESASSLFGAVITLSMASTPLLMKLAGRLRPDTNVPEVDLVDPEHSGESNIIIVGQGRFGQTASQILEGAGHSVTLIDINTRQIDSSSSFGRKVFYGDGTRIDLLRRAGAENADAILFCLDDRKLKAEALEPIKRAFPTAALFARAYDRSHSIALQSVPNVTIVRELYESAITMSAKVLLKLGLEADRVHALISDFRDRDLRRLAAQREAGDMKAGMEMVYGARFLKETEDYSDEAAGHQGNEPAQTKPQSPRDP